jgi:hypothetical protein
MLNVVLNKSIMKLLWPADGQGDRVSVQGIDEYMENQTTIEERNRS